MSCTNTLSSEGRLLAVILLSFLPCKRFIKFFITPLSKLARIGLEAAVIAMIEVLTSTGPLGIHFFNESARFIQGNASLAIFT